jgi:hypothetical protein
MTGWLATAEVCDPTSGTWSSVASMDYSRADHTATLLPNGRILVAGGMCGGGYASVYYDPGTDRWSNVLYSFAPGQWPTATLLANGKVLLAGGDTGLPRAELYDSTTNVWKNGASMSVARSAHTATLLSSGHIRVAGGFSSLSYDNPIVNAISSLYSLLGNTWYDPPFVNNINMYPRALHTATLLPGDKVLLAGGTSGNNATPSAEFFEGSSYFSTYVENMTTYRVFHTATLLITGNILVAGGYNQGDMFNDASVLASSEQYNPVTAKWAGTASMSTARYAHTATLLPNGKVLVTGGSNEVSTLTSTELYDPTSNTWSGAGNMSSARELHTATLLNNGKVLVTGGYNGTTDRADAQLYDPATNTWSSAGSMTSAREMHTATLLPNGKVLITGGVNGNTALASVELYDPATNSWSMVASMSVPREAHTATLLPSGEVLVIGGDDGANPLTSIEIYSPPEKNAAMVNLGDLILTYDGTPRLVTTSSSPAGLKIVLTYNGSVTAPTDVGTYNVLATVDDPNYAGKTSGILSITPAGTKYSLEILLNKVASGSIINTNNAASGSVINTTAQTVCGAPSCTSLLDPSTYTLQASPSQYFLFSGWSGACSGTWNCSIPLTKNTSVTASFIIDQYHSVLLDMPQQYLWGITPAYNLAADNATIKAWGVEFFEDLNLDQEKKVTLKGGYNDEHTSIIGSTTIHGAITITKGRTVIDNIVIR